MTLGVRFTADVDGTVTGVRFYKGPDNTGTHTGTLWTANGTALATAPSPASRRRAGRRSTFASRCAITKNTSTSRPTAPPVGTLLRDPERVRRARPLAAAAAGGVRRRAPTPTAPASRSTRRARNYLVDVVFEKAAADARVTAQDPAPGAIERAAQHHGPVGVLAPPVTGRLLDDRQAGGARRSPGTATPRRRRHAADLHAGRAAAGGHRRSPSR